MQLIIDESDERISSFGRSSLRVPIIGRARTLVKIAAACCKEQDTEQE